MAAVRFKVRPQGRLPTRPGVVEGLVENSEGMGLAVMVRSRWESR